MKDKKTFKPRKEITQWINPETGKREVKPLIEMSEAELATEGGLRHSQLNLDRTTFVKTPREKSILKRFKAESKKTSQEIKELETKAVLEAIVNSKTPRWDSIRVTVQ